MYAYFIIALTWYYLLDQVVLQYSKHLIYKHSSFLNAGFEHRGLHMVSALILEEKKRKYTFNHLFKIPLKHTTLASV